jgi:AraC-like DNA-binding protein
MVRIIALASETTLFQGKTLPSRRGDQVVAFKHYSIEGKTKADASDSHSTAMKSPISQFAGQYQEWLSVAPLRDHLSRVWVNDLTLSAARDYYVVPDGCVDILWTGESLCVAGPDTHPILEQAPPGCRVVGVRFRPGAAYPWLGVPLSEILNARVPLAEFWKRDASELADRAFRASHPSAVVAVLQRALLGRLATVGPADHQIAFLRTNALTRHHDSKAGGLKELSRCIGISERTLRRRCVDTFGYGFKTLQRILRFQRLFRLVALTTCPDLADLATEAGFADQAHMSREVRRLCIATPAELVAQLSG